MTYTPRTPPPVPTKAVKHRPVERRPSPFSDIEVKRAKSSKAAERARLQAQREARVILNRLDERRRESDAAARDRRDRRRQQAQTQTQHQAGQPNDSKLTLTDDALRELIQAGRGAREISRQTGISGRTIRRRANRLGLTFTTRRSELATAIDPGEIRRLRAQGMSWRAMADHFGVTYTTIRRHRDKHGINPTLKGRPS